MLRYLVAAQSRCLALPQCKGLECSEKTLPETDMLASLLAPSGVQSFSIINSGSLLLRLDKSPRLGPQATPGTRGGYPGWSGLEVRRWLLPRMLQWKREWREKEGVEG